VIVDFFITILLTGKMILHSFRIICYTEWFNFFIYYKYIIYKYILKITRIFVFEITLCRGNYNVCDIKIFSIFHII